MNINQPMEILALFGGFAAVSQYANHRFLKLPPAVGITLSGLLIIFIINLLDSVLTHFQIFDFQQLENGLMSFDFKKVLLDITISFLLFASAINFEITNLKKWWKQITLLATVSVIISTVVIGVLMYFTLNLLGQSLNVTIPFWFCMLFGAYMSPTDPIAAVAVFKNLANNRKEGEPNKAKHIEVKLLGESLFNDGTGIWLFTAISAVLIGKEQTAMALTYSLIQEILGAIVVGLIIGFIGKVLIKRSDVIGVIMTNISLIAITYVLSNQLHVSSPIAVVIAGLIIGHNIRRFFNDNEEHQIKLFWEYIDEIINVMLFALMSLIALFIDWSLELVLLGFITYPIVVLARWLSVKITFYHMVKTGKALNSSINILSWGGIRGGISLALALSILNSEYGNNLVGITFICVLLSNLLQGMTLKHIIAAYYPNDNSHLDIEPPTYWKVKLDVKIQKLFNKLNKNYDSDLQKVIAENKIHTVEKQVMVDEIKPQLEQVNEDENVIEVAINFVENALGFDGQDDCVDKDINKNSYENSF